MKPIYDFLLRLYPPRYRALFAREMLRAFGHAAQERRSQGWIIFTRFALAEIVGPLIGCGAEWAANLTHSKKYLSEPSPADESRVLPDEVIESQKRLDVVLNRMIYAISHHDFVQARLYSNQELKERDNLRQLRQKYNLDESPGANTNQ